MTAPPKCSHIGRRRSDRTHRGGGVPADGTVQQTIPDLSMLSRFPIHTLSAIRLTRTGSTAISTRSPDA